MKALGLSNGDGPLKILCLGAHSDDIEIGLGGTILSLIASGAELHVHWCVCSAKGRRAMEAETSASAFLKGVSTCRLVLGSFDDSYFPTQARAIKEWLADIRSRFEPDVIFTHARDDAHQDHRQISEVTWNLFRDHLILEYEIPKWDGDLSRPNVYLPLSEKVLEKKTSLLMAHFGTQRSKDWFDPETFKGLARLRGLECRAPERYAEAFHLRKALVAMERARSRVTLRKKADTNR
jgi:LmbE family N-acetylglucosaminyl deacetylase